MSYWLFSVAEAGGARREAARSRQPVRVAAHRPRLHGDVRPLRARRRGRERRHDPRRARRRHHLARHRRLLRDGRERDADPPGASRAATATPP